MKKVLITSLVLIIIICTTFIFKDNKFSLEDKYYNNGEIIQIDGSEYNNLIEKEESFIVFVHIPGVCLFKLPFAPIVEEFVSNTNITIYSLNFSEVNKTNLKDDIKYSPSVVLIKNGEIKNYLDPSKDEDLKYYKNVDDFKDWINTYVKIK